MLCCAVEESRAPQPSSPQAAAPAAPAAITLPGVYGLAPLLRSLAATTSTDSVVAMAVAGGGMNLALCDYG